MTNIYRIQGNDSIICEYFYMLKGKSFIDYTNFFSPSEYGKNDKVTLKYFQ